MHKRLTDTKQTLTELRQSLGWPKLRLKPYNYPKTSSLTKLQLVDTQPFSTTGVNNFCTVYVRNIFDKNESKMRKVWVTSYTCVSTIKAILDVVPSLSSESFIRRFTRSISTHGCRENITTENGKKSVLKE